MPRFGEPVSDEQHVERSRIMNEPRNRTRLRLRSGVVCKDMGGCKYNEDVLEAATYVIPLGIEYGGVALLCHTYSGDYNFFSQMTMWASLELAMRGDEAPELREPDDDDDLWPGEVVLLYQT